VNTRSASPAEPSSPADAGHAGHAGHAGDTVRILVWDAPVRVFHWLMVISFAGAYLSAESERWRLLHVTLGYTLAGLIVFRLLWGLVGTRHARFASFVRGPRAAWHYLRALTGPRPQHHVGHNPAGALAIVALLGLGLVVTASGWVTFQDLAGEWAEELHEVAGNLMLGVVLLHVAGVVVGSWRHHENLVRAMVTGHKLGATDDGIRRAWRSLAGVMLVTVLAFWAWQWQTAPAPGTLAAAPADGGARHAASGIGHDDDHDDD